MLSFDSHQTPSGLQPIRETDESTMMVIPLQHHRRSLSKPAFDGKLFPTTHSYVLARQTIWSPTAATRHAVPAPWPTVFEQVAAGDIRVNMNRLAGRVMPQPRPHPHSRSDSTSTTTSSGTQPSGHDSYDGNILLSGHGVSADRYAFDAFGSGVVSRWPVRVAKRRQLQIHQDDLCLALGADLMKCLDM